MVKGETDQTKGLVFNIQRFSIQDGPGIRTTVFMKGCPLSCLWCSNPESQEFYPIIMTRDMKCIGCGKCVEICPENAITLDNDNGRVIDFTKCNQCLECARNCPSQAIVISGQYMTVKEISSIAERDMIFYQNSGGGVTVSGGEPCSQAEFIEELLKELKAKGMHTALDTSGYVSWNKLERILDYVDLVLYDIKHLDEKEHLKGTGKRNELILSNLEKVAKKARTWLRIPVIINYNASEKHFYELYDLGKKVGVEQISLLPYHEWGKSKYQQIGKNYTFQGKTPEPEYLQRLQKLGQNFGLKVAIGH
jgi:pyruvate formate lyase activating enzyme